MHGADVLLAEADGLTGAAVRNAPLIPGFLGNPIVQKISALANLIVATTTILGVPNAIVGGFEFIGELTSTPVVLTETPAQHGDPRGA